MPDRDFEIEPAELRRRLEQEPDTLFLLDCREPAEHEAASIAGAELIPMGDIADRLDDVRREHEDRERDVVVMCHHGVRSLRVAVALRQAGIDEARSLAGGIDRWSLEVDPTVPRY